MRRVFRGSAKREAAERLGATSPRSSTPRATTPRAATPDDADAVDKEGAPEAPERTKESAGLLGWVGSKMWGSKEAEQPSAAQLLATQRAEMQAKIQAELDEIAQDSTLLDTLEAYPTPVAPTRPVIKPLEQVLAETQEAEREKWRQAKAAARKKRKEARTPRTMEEEANGLFTELEAAGILTPNTVLQMCEYLEIDAVGEWHLIWIAQACGMSAPVPPPLPAPQPHSRRHTRA